MDGGPAASKQCTNMVSNSTWAWIREHLFNEFGISA